MKRSLVTKEVACVKKNGNAHVSYMTGNTCKDNMINEMKENWITIFLKAILNILCVSIPCDVLFDSHITGILNVLNVTFVYGSLMRVNWKEG